MLNLHPLREVLNPGLPQNPNSAFSAKDFYIPSITLSKLLYCQMRSKNSCSTVWVVLHWLLSLYPFSMSLTKWHRIWKLVDWYLCANNCPKAANSCVPHRQFQEQPFFLIQGVIIFASILPLSRLFHTFAEALSNLYKKPFASTPDFVHILRYCKQYVYLFFDRCKLETRSSFCSSRMH